MTLPTGGVKYGRQLLELRNLTPLHRYAATYFGILVRLHIYEAQYIIITEPGLMNEASII